MGLAAGVALVVVPVAAWALTSPFAGELPEVYRQIKIYGGATPWRQVFTSKVAFLFLLPLVPLAVRGGEWAIARNDAAARTARCSGSVITFAVAWLALEVVGVLVQKRVYAYHFLTLVPPAALLCGLIPVRPRPWVMTVALAPAVALSLSASWPMLRRLGDPPREAGIVAWLTAHARPGDAVWADPSPPVMIPTGLRPGTRYAFTHYFINYDDAPTDFAARIIADLEQRRPEWAVVLNPSLQEKKITEMEEQPGVALNPRRRENLRRAFAEVLDYLHAHYRSVVVVDGVTIARRSDDAADDATTERAQ